MTELQKVLKDDYYPADYPYQKRIAQKGGVIRCFSNFLPLTRNDNCEQLGVITKGLENLSTLPTIKVKLNDLVSDDDPNLKYEIECKNTQERPPNESFNSIGNPFLPCLFEDDKTTENYDLRHPDKLAYVLSRQYHQWKKKIQAVIPSQQYPKLTNIVVNQAMLADLFYDSINAPLPNKKMQIRANQVSKKTRDDLGRIYKEHPFAPVNLYSNCVQEFQEGKKIAYCDHTNKLKIVERNTDNNRFKVVQTIKDAHLGKYSRTYGFKLGEDLIAIKYMDGISIFDMTNSSLVTRHLTKNGFCDMTFISHLDSLLSVDVQGNISLYDYQKGKELILQNDNNISELVEKWQWSQVQTHTENVFWTRILTRKKVSLYDVRKSKIDELYTCPSIEAHGGMVSRKNPFQFYVNTNLKTILLDERYTKIPMTEWYHPGLHNDKSVPQGIDNFYDEQHGLDYVFTYWSDTDVSVVCNDWNHSLCPERVQFENNVKLSCQNPNPTYPLSRGYPALVPSMRHILNEHLFQDERIGYKVKVPWFGLTTFKSENVLKILTVNAVGDLFEASLDNQNTEDTNATTIFVDDTVVEESAVDHLISAEHITLPTDSHRLNWLKFKPLSESETQSLNHWESTQPIFQKLSFITKLQKRSALPTKSSGKTLKHTLMEHQGKIQGEYRRGGSSDFQDESNPEFENCYGLSSKATKNVAKPLDQDILNIFEDRPIQAMLNYLSETGSDTETEADFKSMKSRERERKRVKLSGVPEDPDYTMDQFLQFDPDVTSTQRSSQSSRRQASQSLFSQDLLNSSTQDHTMNSSNIDTVSRPESRTSSVRKKKKPKPKRKSVIGF